MLNGMRRSRFLVLVLLVTFSSLLAVVDVSLSSGKFQCEVALFNLLSVNHHTNHHHKCVLKFSLLEGLECVVSTFECCGTELYL